MSLIYSAKRFFSLLVGVLLLTTSFAASHAKSEKEELMNQLMDNGIENLTENDKKILPFLAK